MRYEKIAAIAIAPTSARPSAVTVAVATDRNCWRTSVNGTATRTNAIAGCCTGTATYSMSIFSVAL